MQDRPFDRLSERPRRPYSAAMVDVRNHDMMIWLRQLPPQDRLAMMYAIERMFPIVTRVHAWTAGLNEALAELQPTSQEHDCIVIESGRIARGLEGQLKAGGPLH
jgi:hypothetical protein